MIVNEMTIDEKKEALIDWINKMDEFGLNDLIIEFLDGESGEIDLTEIEKQFENEQ